MSRKLKQSLNDVEFVNRNRKVFWKCRRPTSILIDPSEDYMNVDLEISQINCSFNKMLGYYLNLDPISVEHAKQDLQTIFEERRITQQIQQPKKDTQKQLKIRKQNLQLLQASKLLQLGYQRWYIKSQLGITNKIISSAQQRICTGRQIFICKTGHKQTLTPEDIIRLRSASENDRLKNKSRRRTKNSGMISRSNFCRFLKQEVGLSYKYYSVQKENTNTEDVIQDRIDFAQHLCPQIYKGRKIIFLDETSCWDRPTLRRSWLPRGSSRIHVDEGKGLKYSIIGAMSCERLEGYMIVKQGMLAEQFMNFIAQLAQNLSQEGNLKNCLFVCDNAKIHDAVPVWNIIYEQIPILFLPAYSPQLNPIELVWGLFKNYLSRIQFQDEHTMLRAIKKSFTNITSNHCKQFYNHSLRYLKDALNGIPFSFCPNQDI